MRCLFSQGGILTHLLIFFSIWMERSCARVILGCFPQDVPVNPLNSEKFQNSAKLNSAFLKSRVYAVLLTLLTLLSILNVIVS